MSNMTPPPIARPRSTVLPPSPTPLSDVERAAEAFARAKNQGAAVPPQAASPAVPSPVSAPAAAPVSPAAQIPRSFIGIDFRDGTVIADTGQRFAIEPGELPQLFRFSFEVALRALQGEVEALRESLGIPDPLAAQAAQAAAQMGGTDGQDSGEGVEGLPDLPEGPAPL